MKRIIIILMLLLLCNSNIYAESEIYTEGYFNYVIEDNNTVTIVNYFGDKEYLEIPSMIVGYPVAGIKDDSFDDSRVKTVVLPETIVTFDTSGFDGSISFINKDNINKDLFDDDQKVVDQIVGDEIIIIDKKKEDNNTVYTISNDGIINEVVTDGNGNVLITFEDIEETEIDDEVIDTESIDEPVEKAESSFIDKLLIGGVVLAVAGIVLVIKAIMKND